MSKTSHLSQTHALIQVRYCQTWAEFFMKLMLPIAIVDQSHYCQTWAGFFMKLMLAIAIVDQSHYCQTWTEVLKKIFKLINYSCSSYPTRASYSGQVDEFRNPMKNELKTPRPCLKQFQTNSKPKLFAANVECNGTVIKEPKKEKAIFFLNLSSRSMVVTSCFGSLSTLLYTSDLKRHWR